MQKDWPPHLTVAAVIENEGKFLIVEEEDQNQTVYNQPAGHVELNETLITATVRETLEETGWLYQPSAIIGIYLNTNPTTGITYQRICFTGQLIDYQPEKRLIDEITAVHWWALEEIVAKSKNHRSPMVLKCIQDYQSNARYPLELINDLRNI